MSDIKMPEAVAWQIHPADYGIGSKGVYARTDRAEQVEAWKRKGWEPTPLITTDQAEAYAQAARREALEEAEQAIITLMQKQTSVRAADAIEAIRALIPSTPA